MRSHRKGRTAGWISAGLCMFACAVAWAQEDEAPEGGAGTDPFEWISEGNNLFLAIAVVGIAALVGFLLAYLMRGLARGTPHTAEPEPGRVIGRIPLTSNASLHFVESAGRVLAIGVTPQHVSLVADFEAAAFGRTKSPATPVQQEFDPDSFLSQLRQSSTTLSQAARTSQPDVDPADDEIMALRNDIQRLQRYLREETREPEP